MSVSTINATTGSMAAAAAVLQAQAVQYSNHFATLQNAVSSGNLGEARQALSVFQRDSAVASLNGYDPVNQTAALRQNFSALKKALTLGDIRTAQSSLSTLQKEMTLSEKQVGANGGASADLQTLDTAIQQGNLPFAKKALAAFSKDVALNSAGNSAGGTNGSKGAVPLNSGSKAIRDIRSLQVAISSGDQQKTSTTYIKVRPELASFAQGPLVFPTSEAAVTRLSVNTSTQAVLQSMAAIVFNGLSDKSDGTSFAPTPELLLGSKGITIPPGADLPISRTPFILKGLSLKR